MKKCNRCNNVLDWEKPFCPLCGGQVIDVPRSERPEPVAASPVVVENIGAPQVPQAAAHVEPPSPPAPQLPPAHIAAVPPPPVPPIPASAIIPSIPPPVPQLPSSPPIPTAGIKMPPQPIPDVPLAGMISQIHQSPASSILPNLPKGQSSGISRQEDPPLDLPKSGQREDSLLDFPKSGQREDSPLDLLKSGQQNDSPLDFLISGQQPQTMPNNEPKAAKPQAEATYNPLDAFLGEEKNLSPESDVSQFDEQIAEILRRGAPGAHEHEMEDTIAAMLQSGPKFDDDGNSEEKDTGAVLPLSYGADEEPSSIPPFSPPGLGKNVIPNLPDDVKPKADDNSSQDDFLRMFPKAKG